MSNSPRVGRGGRLPLLLALVATLVAPQSVLAAEITVTASSDTMVYGGTVPVITPDYSGAPPDTTPPTCSTAATSTSPVASYISSCSGAVDTGNTFTYVDGSVSVTPASLGITASSTTMVYGTTPPPITPTYTGLTAGDLAPATAPTCSTTATSTSDVAAYASSCTGAADGNYVIGYTPGSVSVTPANLGITASSHTMGFGATPPSITPGYSGLAGGDLAPATLPTCSTTATSSSPVGDYPSTCSSASDSNYTIGYIAGNVHVAAAALGVTASSGTMVYGGTPPLITPSYSGPTPTTLPTCSTAATSASNVGIYASSCSGATLPNHTIGYTAGSVSVTPAPLTITAASSTMQFGSNAPTIRPNYSGLKNGSFGTATPPSCSTTANNFSPVGTIWPTTCTGAVDANYVISYVAGTITVLAGNSAPVCTNKSANTSMNGPGTGQLACTDPDFNVLQYVLVTGTAHGTVTLSDAGIWKYTPTTDYLGTDSFTFKANDTLLSSNTATFTLTVEPDPTAHNDVASIHQGSGPRVIAVLANDVDNDPGDHLTITAVTQGAHGVVAISADGMTLTYDPTGSFLGTDSFSYTITDVTKRTSTAFVQVKVVPVRPVTTTPVVTIVAPSALGAFTVPVRVTWNIADPGTGLKRYELQELRGGGSWTSVGLTSLTTRSATRNLTFGTSVRYRVRAIDTANHVGAWATGLLTTPSLNQETASAILYTGTWRTGTGRGLSGGQSRYSGAGGATATYTFTGVGIGWVSQLGPRLGTATVFVDGTLVKVVNLRSTTVATKRFVFSKSFSTRGAHTIRIVVLGAPGGARIDADAFAVLK